MAEKLIKEMGLPKSIANVFAARNITTAKVKFNLQNPSFFILNILQKF